MILQEFKNYNGTKVSIDLHSVVSVEETMNGRCGVTVIGGKMYDLQESYRVVLLAVESTYTK